MFYHVSMNILLDPDNMTMADFDDLLNLESPNGYGKNNNINCLITRLCY